MEHFLKLSAVQYVCFSALSSKHLMTILGFLKLLQLKMCTFFMLFFFSLFVAIFFEYRCAPFTQQAHRGFFVANPNAWLDDSMKSPPILKDSRPLSQCDFFIITSCI